MNRAVTAPTSVAVFEKNTLMLNSRDVDNAGAEAPLTESVPGPLEGVIACIEVRDYMENRFKGIAKQLEKLGGKAVTRLTKEVTHLIFKDGKPHLKEKAEKRNIPVVSVLWLENCRLSGEKVSEETYPVISEEFSPAFSSRSKRRLSMQPKPFHEELAMSLQRDKRRRALKEKRDILFGSENCPATASPVLVENTQPTTPASLTPLLLSKGSKRKGQVAQLSSSGESKKPSSLEMQSNFWGFTYSDMEDEEEGEENQAFNPSKKLTFDDSGSTDGLVCEVGESPSTIPSVKTGDLSATPKPANPSKKRKLLNRKELSSVSLVTSTESQQKKVRSKEGKKPVSSDPLNKGKKAKTKTLLKSSKSKKPKRIETPGISSGDEFTPSMKKNWRTKKVSVRSSTRKVKQSLTVTSLTHNERDIAESVVSKLGGFQLVNEVRSSTTHVICGKARRTINVLKGIAQGCWLLSFDWILTSLESGKWVDEEKFEVYEKFPGAKISRLKKQKESPGILSSAPLIFVSKEAEPSHSVLTELVQLCGGQLAGTRRNSEAVCVGRRQDGVAGTWVSEKWILDSVSNQEIMPSEEYHVP
eukprot:m.310502 g.310502  ORF g.310502 m.310502 type:complete len:585 (+) comp52066_c0_seq1:51-1805(+)